MDGLKVEGGQVTSVDSSPEQKSFRGFLARLKNHWHKKNFPVPPQDATASVIPITEEENEVTGIADFINAEIQKKELKSPEFKSEGASGFSVTNERINPGILHEIKDSENAPDGYLIGVGVSNIFSLLDTFPEGKIPKGIVLINIDPRAAKQAEYFVNHLKQGKIVDFASGNPYVFYDSKSVFARKDNGSQESYEKKAYHEGKKQVYTGDVIERHKELLFQLAREGNIAVLQQNILDQNLVEILTKLPGFKASNNVVYLSNIVDWIYRDQAWKLWEQRFAAHTGGLPQPPDLDLEELFKPLLNLDLLKPEFPHKNLFADTLGSKSGLHYQLRISDRIPQFKQSDFNLFD